MNVYSEAMQDAKAIRVSNTYGRTDTIPEMPDGLTGEVAIPEGHDKLMCSRCKCNIYNDKRHGYMQTSRLYVDSDKKAWCRDCWWEALETTMRSVKKNPDETRTRHIVPDGRYYKLLKEKE